MALLVVRLRTFLHSLPNDAPMTWFCRSVRQNPTYYCRGQIGRPARTPGRPAQRSIGQLNITG